MVPWAILGEHGLALLLVWAAALAAGCALLPIARLRVGWAGAPLLGVVYWSVALYLFPFPGGLDVAAGVVAILAGISVWRAPSWTPIGRRWSVATLILVVGSLPYLTTLLFHYVPSGMDASMHTTAAALIGQAHGLPATYAPFAPEVPLPPMNLGLPALAGVAVRWGAEPAAAMLACQHLTFTILTLATYLLLRRWIARTPAAVIAVVSVWTARASQASLEWGGFPTVLSVAVGIFAVDLMLKQARVVHWRLSVATGLTIAAIPLIHGVGAGTWLYCVAPPSALATLALARSRFTTLRGLAVSALATVVMLVAYRNAGSFDVQLNEMEWTHAWQQSSAHLGEHAWLSAWNFIRKDAGSAIVVSGWAALGVLLVCRNWQAFLALGSAWLSLATVVANSRWWVLPGSFLLYPERAIYWAAPLSAVGIALAWRSLPAPLHGPKVSLAVLIVCVLALAAYQHNQFYQKIVREVGIDHDRWQALVWAREHLHPECDFVDADYNSAGSYLPAVARIGCTGAHHHHFIQRHVMLSYQNRPITHRWCEQGRAPGTVVFSNSTVTIVRLER